MINSLIVPPQPKDKEITYGSAAAATGAHSSARMFVGSMGDAHRERFKAMLMSGVECGHSIAQSYNVPRDEFIAEVKKII